MSFVWFASVASDETEAKLRLTSLPPSLLKEVSSIGRFAHIENAGCDVELRLL